MDFLLEWNGDLVTTPSGGVQSAVAWDQQRERIIRHFLTNSTVPLPDGDVMAPDYIFAPTWGLSGGALVDQNPTRDFLADLRSRAIEAVRADANTNGGQPVTVLFEKPTPDTILIYVDVPLRNGASGRVQITL